MPIDLDRRKKVMARSRKLGHCVCNVKKTCPCDIFSEQNVCPCAGERPTPPDGATVNLMSTVAKAGCASKIPQGDLKRILGALPEIHYPNIMVGMAAGDDAGVWKLDEHTALVQTVDVFTPCVNDPYLFGQIAAANSLSDVYAMGGRPITALSIACFPIDDLPGEVLQEMLRGGIDKLNEAGCALIGGHSVNDPEVKLGFAVTGVVDPARVTLRGAAQPGDLLVLTKPMGTGLLTFAAQLGRLAPGALAEAGASMATLNRDAAALLAEFGAHAATDVTGFGLAGHLVELARTSGVSAELDLRALPVFAAVPFCLEHEILSGAIERNQEYSMAWVRNEDPEHERNLPLLYDPQTSGGLLVSLPESRAAAYVDALHARGHAAAAIIGRIMPQTTGAGGAAAAVVVTHAALENLIGESGVPLSAAAARNALPRVNAAQPRVSGAPSAEPRKGDRIPTPAAPAPEPRTVFNSTFLIPRSPFSVEVNIMSEAPSADPSCCSGALPAAHPSPAPLASPGAATCCDAPPTVTTAAAAAATGEALDLFKDFMKAANAPGLIDPRHKKLMAIMLSIAVRCTPCLRIHLKSALAMGLTKPEIDEAASLAIAFGGCSALMFYKEICEELKIA